MLEQFENENSEREGGQSIQNQHEIENHREHENKVDSHDDHDPNFPQQVVGSEDEHYNEPSSSTNDEHFGDLQNYHQLQSGQNTEWSSQLNEPGHPSSSQGPWNQPFDSNEHYPLSHGHCGQGQDATWGYPLHHRWYPLYRHPNDLHQIQSGQSQNTMSGDHLNDPVNPPSFQNPLDQQNPWDWNRFH
uniref:Uncharacterized protein n=1 Tax=Meloidogyne javanica TaxID=6303 RepID=A0A915LRN5_MELJA